jgi:hypothetical protein
MLFLRSERAIGCCLSPRSAAAAQPPCAGTVAQLACQVDVGDAPQHTPLEALGQAHRRVHVRPTTQMCRSALPCVGSRGSRHPLYFTQRDPTGLDDGLDPHGAANRDPINPKDLVDLCAQSTT